MVTLNVTFKETSTVLDASFSDNDHLLMSEIQIDYSGDPSVPYDGPYDATPTINRQVFPTKNKKMLDDFTVQKVPYKEEPLPGGGYSIIIL